MKPALLLIIEWHNTLTDEYGMHTQKYVKSTPTALRRLAQKIIVEWNEKPAIVVDAARIERVSDEVVIWTMSHEAKFYTAAG
jgi:hypothetical protein